MSEEKSVIVKAKEGVVETIKGTGDITSALLELVSGTLVTALKGTRAIGTEAGNLVKDTIVGSVQGVSEVGAELGSAAKGIMVGSSQRHQRSDHGYPRNDWNQYVDPH